MDDYDVHLINLFISHATPIIYQSDKRTERADILAAFFTDDGWFNDINGKANILKKFEIEQPIRGVCTRIGFVETVCGCGKCCGHVTPHMGYYECVMYKGLGDVEVIRFYFKDRNHKTTTAGIGNEFGRVEIKPAERLETLVSSVAGGFWDAIKYVSKLY